MITGALIFAFNNEEIDYVSMAAWSAKNIHRHLDIPVCVVTDRATKHTEFDRVVVVERYDTDSQRYFEDINGNVTWYNHGRVDAYSLTPWDQTLVLDADYVVASDQLKSVLSAGEDFMSHRLAWDITTGDLLDNLNTFGSAKMPMWWATVMMFRRSNIAQYIFDTMLMVRNNWQHYRNIYGIGKSTYRNDHALSIALNLVSGHTLQTRDIPWSLASVMPSTTLKQVDQDRYCIEYIKNGTPMNSFIAGLDFHAMGKRHLGDIVASQS